MQKVTASEYSKKVGLYQTVAQREPVVITSHGRDETVLISAEEYRRLTRRRRRPYRRSRPRRAELRWAEPG